MFEKLFGHKITLIVLATKETILSGFHMEFMTQVYLNLNESKGDEFTYEFRVNTVDDTQIELVVKTTEKRYQNLMAALRRKGITLVYNKNLKAAEMKAIK